MVKFCSCIFAFIIFVPVLVRGQSDPFPSSGSSGDSAMLDAQDAIPSFMLNEICLGLGAAHSMEKDMFNVPNDVSAGTTFGIALSYLRNIDEHFAVGADMYGFVKSVDDATLTTNGTSNTLTLNVSVFNIGAIGRYIFTRKNVQPYGFLVLAYTTGSLTNDALGRLGLNGFSGGGGLGVNIGLGPAVALSFEGVASFGSAKWEQHPFTNSTSDEFNPSMFLMLAKLSYLWD